MHGAEITLFRKKLNQDIENKRARQTFHEQYEWLDAYWDEKYKSNEIRQFSKEFHSFYWKIKELTEIAREYSIITPVGNSDLGFEPTLDIERATFYLKYKCDLHNIQLIEVETEIEKANDWKYSAFYALMLILKQIRDNLFHGKKMELNNEPYERNKLLVDLASKATTIILDNLEEAEASLG